jgi:hypothetical protein
MWNGACKVQAGTAITVNGCNILSMELKNILMVGLLAFAVGCNEAGRQDDNAKENTSAGDTDISTTPIPLDGCYSMIFKDDTASMRLNMVDSLVTGDLSYRLYAKDSNEGSIKGTVRDSLIIAYYTFRSEGTMSVRQVVFKVVGTSLVEGYGDLNTNHDTVRFKNIHQLSFQNDRPFIKTPCLP